MSLSPLVFEPYLRPAVWGARRLGETFGKKLPDDQAYGESWEVSGHPSHVSKVSEGPLAGAELTELCRDRADELYGESPKDERFPLLIKLLDCDSLLSIQVHPTDALAEKLIGGGERGKTEAWIVLDVEPEGLIYAGLKEGVSRDVFERHLREGTTDQCLASFHPKPGDCIFLRSGTVHAVGKGVVIAEVQQTSDATFRLFDWNRLGTDGKPRTLHIDEGLEAVDYSRGPVAPVDGVPLPNLPDGVRGERLAECEFFVMDRYRLGAELPVPPGRLSIWMVLEGEAGLAGDGYDRMFSAGETVLVPGTSAPVRWKGAQSATLLGVGLPQ